jgi:ribosomal-protein-alanine N-acetyltransferase
LSASRRRPLSRVFARAVEPLPAEGALRALATVSVDSPRLRLRFLAEGDGPLLAASFSQNREWLAPWDPVRPRDFFTAAFQERAVESARREAMRDQSYRFAAFHRFDARGEEEDEESSRTLAGVVAVANIVRGAFQSATLGYWIVESHSGRGLGREMVGAAVNWAFERAGLHRVQAAIQPDNERSRRLILSLGFRREGFAPRYLKIAGEWARP